MLRLINGSESIWVPTRTRHMSLLFSWYVREEFRIPISPMEYQNLLYWEESVHFLIKKSVTPYNETVGYKENWNNYSHFMESSQLKTCVQTCPKLKLSSIWISRYETPIGSDPLLTEPRAKILGQCSKFHIVEPFGIQLGMSGWVGSRVGYKGDTHRLQLSRSFW